jgi:NAD-dependent dihydropyrimidine dehydrogenase PreA subunit
MVYLAGTSTLKIQDELCTGCAVCIEVCPRGTLEIRDRKATVVDLDLCMECGACERNCEYGAITVQAGVGCAAALIGSLKSGGTPTCGCGDDDDGGASCCG